MFSLTLQANNPQISTQSPELSLIPDFLTHQRLALCRARLASKNKGLYSLTDWLVDHRQRTKTDNVLFSLYLNGKKKVASFLILTYFYVYVRFLLLLLHFLLIYLLEIFLVSVNITFKC
jgi:hypothetical protein